LLRQAGFDITKTHSLACPAFLFEPKWNESTHLIQSKYKLNDSETLKVGFIVCGWNFEEGPFDKWPREDHEFEKFACAVEELELKHNAVVYLLSHSNGFPLPPADFELIHGRDYMVIKRLEEVLLKRNIASKYIVIEDVMDAWTTKAIIGSFDILVSGRIHGAVAGLSQLVPTVIIDYGHEPKAHKLKGFVIEAAASDYLADPSSEIGLKETISKAVRNRQQYKQVLEESIPRAKLKAKRNIQILKDIVV
jgi:colanic acid/amylovoran biosynthesis protein